MKLPWKTTETIRNDMSLPDVWWIKYVDHVNAVESSWADADKAIEAMRDACIAAVKKFLDKDFEDPYQGYSDAWDDALLAVLAALRKVQP